MTANKNSNKAKAPAEEAPQVQKEIIKHTSVRYKGDYFYITVSDRDKVSLDNKLADMDIDGIRRWVLKHMHALSDPVPVDGAEGLAFQHDLVKFMKVLAP